MFLTPNNDRRFNSIRRVMVGVVFILVAAVASAQVPSTYSPATSGTNSGNVNRTSAAERSLAALDLAILASESGLEDVAFEAVRRAVRNGPPVVSINIGGLLATNPSPRTSTAVPANSNAVHDNQTELADRLTKVHQAWQAAEFEPDECFNLWKELVFPSARPSEAFTYSTLQNARNSYSYSVNLDESAPAEITFAAMHLVEWARQANQLSSLRSMLSEKKDLPTAKSTVMLLRILLSHDDKAEAEKICDELSVNPNLMISESDSALLMSLAVKLLENLPMESPARARLWQALLEGTKSSERWASNSWLRYAVIQETNRAIKAGDIVRFQELAEVSLSILAPLVRSGGNAEYIADTTAAFYSAAAKKAFEAEQTALGLACLKHQAMGMTSGTSVDSEIFRPNSQVLKQLLKLTPQQRFDALFDMPWHMPMLGLGKIAQVAPQDAIPNSFIEAYKSYRKVDKQPVEQVTAKGSYSLSLLEWMMKDAIVLNKQDAIEAKLSELQEKKSDDLALARLVFAKAKGEPLDLELVRSQNAEGKSVLRADGTGSAVLLPLDLEIAWIALQHDTTRQEGIELAERLADRAVQIRVNEVLQARAIAAAGRLRSANAPASSESLLHFVKADEMSGVDIQSGRPTDSIWLENSPGVWEHVACAGRSRLLLKYPLVGDYEIEFECWDDPYAEGGATFCGVDMDFRGYLSDIGIYAIGNATQRVWANQHIKKGEFVHYKIRRNGSAGAFTLFCENNEIGTLRVGEQEFPFFGMQSLRNRKTQTRNIRISGDVSIPRSIALLTPSLLGWSAAFKGRSLPGVNLFENSAEQATPVPGDKRADLNFDWQLVGSQLESVDHASLMAVDKANGLKVVAPKYPPREEWIYYIRPLCDGEQVDFEFYQEKGKFSVHPTIDRIAVWFDEPKLRQHWITSDSGTWLGVNSTNRVGAPAENALAAAQLQEAAWNACSLRREGDNILLTVNGTDIYQQTVDSSLGGRFGFFHDSTQFQVKVRNVVLRGDWPEALPADIFEKRAK